MADQGELSSRDRTWTESLFDVVYDLVPGDHLKKREFADAIRSRFEWTPAAIPTDLLDLGQETGQTVKNPTPWGVFNNLISAGAVAMPGPGGKAKELAKKAVEKVDQFAGPAAKWLNELVPSDVVPKTPFKQTVYHGTNADYNFDKGGFFAFDEGLAKEYGTNVHQAEVTLNNPLELKTGQEVKDLWETVGAGEQFHGTEHASTSKLKKWAEEQGYDGVVVHPSAFEDELGYEWAGGTFGEPQIMAFKKEGINVKPLSSGPQEEVGQYLETLGPAISKLYNRGFQTGHISAHDFDKFDISKVLSGEGTIMEGSGIYSTNEPAVLPYYIDQFTKVNYKDLSKDDPQRAALNKVHNYMSSGLDQKAAINAAYVDIGNAQGTSGKPLISYDLKTADVFEELGKWRKDGIPKGLIEKPFKYDIHMDADQASMPEWHNDFEETSPALKRRILEAFAEYPGVDKSMLKFGGTSYSQLYNEIFKAKSKEAGLKGLTSVSSVRGGNMPTYDPGNKVDVISKQLVTKLGDVDNAYDYIINQAYDDFEPNMLNDIEETLMNWLNHGIDFESMPKKTPAQVAADTSNYFYKKGIPGHKYLPGEGRFDDVGTRNFVSYDDEFMSIIGKTKLALMIGLPATALLTDEEAKAYEAENAR